MRAIDRLTGRGAAAEQGGRVLRRNDAGDLVPVDPAPAAGDGANLTTTEAGGTKLQNVREIEGKGYLT